MRLNLYKIFRMRQHLAVALATALNGSAAWATHIEERQIDSISEALQAVTDCAVEMIKRLDDSRTSADVIARVIEPACDHYLTDALDLACRGQDEEYCDTVRDILDPQRLYPEIVLQYRAQTRRGPSF